MTAPGFADAADAAAYAQYQQAQIDEYSAWVAAGDIYVGGALAFTLGHPVPKSTVEANGWDKTGQVTPAGLTREEQLRARQAELDREREAIAAELAAAEAPAKPKKATGKAAGAADLEQPQE